MTTPALELRDVEVVYERRGRERVRAVAGASLTVERGQIVGLVGESGCGKSSLGRAAVGLVRPAAGSVVFEGRDGHATRMGRRSPPYVRIRLRHLHGRTTHAAVRTTASGLQRKRVRVLMGRPR